MKNNKNHSKTQHSSLPFPINPLLNPMLKKSNTKTSNQSELKKAYDLVTVDLFQNLKKAQDGAIIKLGDLGAFHKKRTTIQSALDGNTYRYYRISFKISAKLKGRNL
jgi:hypothetical protein